MNFHQPYQLRLTDKITLSKRSAVFIQIGIAGFIQLHTSRMELCSASSRFRLQLMDSLWNTPMRTNYRKKFCRKQFFSYFCGAVPVVPLPDLCAGDESGFFLIIPLLPDTSRHRCGRSECKDTEKYFHPRRGNRARWGRVGGVRGEGGEFVAQHIFQRRDLNHYQFSGRSMLASLLCMVSKLLLRRA